MDIPKAVWPFVVLGCVDVLVLSAYVFLFVIRTSRPSWWHVYVDFPFALAYVICLTWPLVYDVHGIVFKLSSETWWVECTTTLLVGAWMVIRRFTADITEKTLLLFLTVISVMLPCMGLSGEEHQIFYIVLVSHVLHVLLRLRDHKQRYLVSCVDA